MSIRRRTLVKCKCNTTLMELLSSTKLGFEKIRKHIE